MAGVINEAGNAYPSGAPGSTSLAFHAYSAWVVHLAISHSFTYIFVRYTYIFQLNIDLDVTARTLSITAILDVVVLC